MARVPEGFGVRRRPDRSVRMQPGEATLDPGMRAQAGQFTDVTSPGYARQAAAQAERGGAMEFGTSAEAMRDKERDDLVMSVVGAVLAMMTGARSAPGSPAGPGGGFIRQRGAGRPSVDPLNPPARSWSQSNQGTNFPAGRTATSPQRIQSTNAMAQQRYQEYMRGADPLWSPAQLEAYMAKYPWGREGSWAGANYWGQ